MGKAEEAAVAYRTYNPLRKVEGRQTAAKVIPVFQWSAQQKIQAIKEGVSKTELENLKDQTGTDYDTLSKILAVTKATLHSKKGKARFNSSVSERILLLAEIYSFGYSVFKDKDRFNQWMKTPVRTLGSVTPLSLTDTMYGMEEVKNEIGRIAYGVYS